MSLVYDTKSGFATGSWQNGVNNVVYPALNSSKSEQRANNIVKNVGNDMPQSNIRAQDISVNVGFNHNMTINQ